MFERFTERARQVVVLAQDEARALKHNDGGTEHLLLGLVRDKEGVASQILLDLGADAERVRNEVVRVFSEPARHQRAVAEAHAVFPRPLPRRGGIRPVSRGDAWPVAALLTGWALGTVTLGLGILIGWAIWG